MDWTGFERHVFVKHGLYWICKISICKIWTGLDMQNMDL